MTAAEIEQAVYDLEQVRIVIRAPARAVMKDYTNVRASPGTSSVAEWLAQRILPLIGNNEVVVIDGNGAVPHGRTRMATLRESYDR